MAIKITKLSNGILFDLTTESGAGTTKPNYVFRPAHFSTIIQTKVYNNRFEYTSIENRDFIFSCDGTTPDAGIIDEIDGIAVTTNQDLFIKFNATL